MIDAKVIKEAVASLDPADDSVWEADKTPKLTILQTLTGEPTLSPDDVDEAIGAFKRGDKLKNVKAVAKPAAAKDETPEIDLAGLDPNSPEFARAVATKARAEDVRLKAELDDIELQREKLSQRVRELTALRDAQILLIEKYEPQVSHADMVKRIQRQTIEHLTATRERQVVAQQMFGPGGTAVQYPSRLDATLAMRQRTPEQKKNYAAYVHQQAAGNRPPA